MNEFDQFAKHTLKVKYYARYTDDFVLLDEKKESLEKLLPRIADFLLKRLTLRLHPNKITLRPLHQGVDFLGFVILPYHKMLRTKTKQRIFQKLKRQVGEYNSGKIEQKNLNQSIQSYLGVLLHANTHRLSENLKNRLWFCLHYKYDEE